MLESWFSYLQSNWANYIIFRITFSVEFDKNACFRIAYLFKSCCIYQPMKWSVLLPIVIHVRWLRRLESSETGSPSSFCYPWQVLCHLCSLSTGRGGSLWVTESSTATGEDEHPVSSSSFHPGKRKCLHHRQRLPGMPFPYLVLDVSQDGTPNPTTGTMSQ